MSKPTAARARRSVAILTAAALILTGGLVLARPPHPAPSAPSRSSAASRASSDAPGDWQPECAATDLAPTADAGVYAARVRGARRLLRVQGRGERLVGRVVRARRRRTTIPLTVGGPVDAAASCSTTTTHRVGVEVVSLRGGLHRRRRRTRRGSGRARPAARSSSTSS